MYLFDNQLFICLFLIESIGGILKRWKKTENFFLESERGKEPENIDKDRNFWECEISGRALEIVEVRDSGDIWESKGVYESVGLVYKLGYFKSSSKDPRK